MLKVNFLQTTKDGQKECGYLMLESKKSKIKLRPAEGFKTMFQNIMHKEVTPEEKKQQQKDPWKWLESLPAKYSGAYLRAQLEIV